MLYSFFILLLVVGLLMQKGYTTKVKDLKFQGLKNDYERGD